MNTVVNIPPRGSIVTTRDRASGQDLRKVYIVVDKSRAPGKVRTRTWSHSRRAWSGIKTRFYDDLVAAPRDWPCTRAASRSELASQLQIRIVGSWVRP